MWFTGVHSLNDKHLLKKHEELNRKMYEIIKKEDEWDNEKGTKEFIRKNSGMNPREIRRLQQPKL